MGKWYEDFGRPMTASERVQKYARKNKDKIQKANSMSLHRIDNSLGYIPGNVAVISFRANALIRDGNLDEFIKIVEYLKT